MRSLVRFGSIIHLSGLLVLSAFSAPALGEKVSEVLAGGPHFARAALEYLAPRVVYEEIYFTKEPKQEALGRRHVFYYLEDDTIKLISSDDHGSPLVPIYDMEGRYAGLRGESRKVPSESAFMVIAPGGVLKEAFRIPKDRSYVGRMQVRIAEGGRFALLTFGGHDAPSYSDPFSFIIRDIDVDEEDPQASVRVKRDDWIIFRYYISPRGAVALEASPKDDKERRYILVYGADGKLLLDQQIERPQDKDREWPVPPPPPSLYSVWLKYLLPFDGGRAAYVTHSPRGKASLVIASREGLRDMEVGDNPILAPVDGTSFIVWDEIERGRADSFFWVGRLRLVDAKTGGVLWSRKRVPWVAEIAAHAKGGYLAVVSHTQSPEHRRSHTPMKVAFHDLGSGGHIHSQEFSPGSIKQRRFLYPKEERLQILTGAELITLEKPWLKDSAEETSLHYRARIGDKERVRKLIAGTAEVDTPDRYRQTPLYIAVKYGQPATARTLIELGADVNAQTKYGEAPLHVAGDEKIVGMLLEAGASVKAQDGEMNTPLHKAVLLDDPRMVELLISAGADPNALNKYGRSPLDEAYSAEVRQLLLHYGAKSAADMKRDKVSGEAGIPRQQFDNSREAEMYRKLSMARIPEVILQLGSSRSREIVRPLMAYAMKESISRENRVAAIQVLGYIKDGRAAPVFKYFLDSTDPNVRTSAINSLLNCGEKELAFKEMVEANRYGIPFIPQVIVEGSYYFDPEAKPYILEMIDMPNVMTRLRAAEYLHYLGDKDISGPVVEEIEKGLVRERYFVSERDLWLMKKLIKSMKRQDGVIPEP